MLFMCVLTVPSEMSSSAAISLFDFPSATHRSTSISRSVGASSATCSAMSVAISGLRPLLAAIPAIISIAGCTTPTQSGRQSPSNRAVVFYDSGDVYQIKGDYDRAIEEYDQAIRLRPDYANAFAHRGSAYSYKGDYDRAIEDQDEAIRLKPDFAEA